MMPRLRRSFILLMSFHQRWEAFGADAADALLQGMDLEDLEIEIFTVPSGDVRRLLGRLMQFAK